MLLKDRKILVVDDELLIAIDIEAALEDAGAEVIGPYTTIATALRAAETDGLSAAVLDVRIGRELITPVARRLADRAVPIVFYSGQKLPDDLQNKIGRSVLIDKPISLQVLIHALTQLVEEL